MSIAAVKEQHEESLMRLPNVTGVGIGEKASKTVIKVFVTHKVAASALRPQEIVPKTLEGYETDVEEIGVVMTTPDDVAVGLLFAGSATVTIANQIENARALLRVEVAEQML